MDSVRAEELLNKVLSKQFYGDPLKQRIDKGGNRLNFSCPYCGDSKDYRKKRGNFYLDTFNYKCYNGGCGVFKNSKDFFDDFSVYDDLTYEEKLDIDKIIHENKKNRVTYGKMDLSMFFESDINEISVKRSEFMKSLRLEEVKNSKILRYIERRYQEPDSRFAWDPKYENLYLFNTLGEDNIIGLQLRRMNSIKGSPKYLTYRLSGIYEKILKADPDKIRRSKEIDPISHVFGLDRINFDLPVTIFEGPMDSWLWKNSVGLCSLENKFPFGIDNVRYWYDWDKPGMSRSIELLSEGKTVFNWKKFLEENGITKNRKWDLNDLVIHLRKTGKKVKRFENYFTNDVLDLGDFISI